MKKFLISLWKNEKNLTSHQYFWKYLVPNWTIFSLFLLISSVMSHTMKDSNTFNIISAIVPILIPIMGIILVFLNILVIKNSKIKSWSGFFYIMTCSIFTCLLLILLLITFYIIFKSF